MTSEQYLALLQNAKIYQAQLLYSICIRSVLMRSKFMLALPIWCPGTVHSIVRKQLTELSDLGLDSGQHCHKQQSACRLPRFTTMVTKLRLNLVHRVLRAASFLPPHQMSEHPDPTTKQSNQHLGLQ